MEKLVIKGGLPLSGRVEVSGAKNAALPCIAATLLTRGNNTLLRVPKLMDVKTILMIAERLGAEYVFKNGVLHINTEEIRGFEAPYELVRTMRASILFLGPLLARLGRAKISLPGGCAIGARPVNLHLKALAQMGADMHLDQGYIYARADRLKGAEIFFDIPTVTGTENVLMAASLARGTTVIRNAASEPEVVDLADYLIAMGAKINGHGTDTIEIEGVDELYPAHHEVIPDRIEAGTYLIALAITQGEGEVVNCRPDHLGALIEKLRLTGADVEVGDGKIRLKGPETIRSTDIKTMPYPGFPTDLQAQFMSLMSIANGASVIEETIFENRFIHVAELRRMGADIEISGNKAYVKGKSRLLAAPVMATDLRASASLVLAGLVAQGGFTEVHRIYHLDRGYEAMEKKLSGLGAMVWREKV